MKKSANYLRFALLAGASAACLASVSVAQDTTAQGTTANEGPAEELRQQSVVVRGQFIPDEKRSTSEVSSLIDAGDFQISGDANAAAALARVAGISTAQDRFVYVRGLNERYSSATLNGSPLPSPEPLRRVAPLDLFPTSVLRSILVQKTFSPQLPGEFGGGLVDIRTKSVPAEAFFEISASVSGDTETTGQDGLLYDGGDLDFLGISHDERTMPDIPESGVNAEFARALTDNSGLLIQQEGIVPPDIGISASGGQRYDINQDISMGVLVAASYSNAWQTRNGKRGFADSDGSGLQERFNHDFYSTENAVDINGFVTVGFDLYDNHEIKGTALIVRSSDKEARTVQGIDFDDNFERDDAIEWFERQLWTTQLSGEHFFPAVSDLRVNWRASYSEALRDAPYQFNILYQDSGNGLQTLANAADTTFGFSRIDDAATNLGIDAVLPVVFGWSDCTYFCETDLKAGYAYTENDRFATSRLFAIEGLPVSSQRIDFLFNGLAGSGDLDVSAIGGNAFPERYQATLEIDAGYVGFDTQITPYIRGAMGARYERAIEAVDTLVIGADPSTNFVEACIDRQPDQSCKPSEDILPAATLTWNLFENLQVRAGYSQTLTRPQFRELAPTEFLNTETDVNFIGNPFLINAEIENYDIRAEYYFGRAQFVTIGAFYKDMTRPIEEINQRTADTPKTTFINIPSAELYGAEVEYEQRLPMFDRFGFDFFRDRDLTIKANYTWSDSKVSAGRNPSDLGLNSSGFCAQFPNECVITNQQPLDPEPFLLPGAGLIEDGRRLQGQSEHLFNFQLIYEDEAAMREVSLLLNYASERIRSGEALALNIPAILEQPPITLDFVWNEGFEFRGGDYELTMKVENLLGDEYEAYQEAGGDRVDVDIYRIGTSIGFGLKRRF
jgi:outer membrane receptor protein involved in Fe transport